MVNIGYYNTVNMANMVNIWLIYGANHSSTAVRHISGASVRCDVGCKFVHWDEMGISGHSKIVYTKVTDTVASKSVQFLSWGIFEFDPCSNAPYVNKTQIATHHHCFLQIPRLSFEIEDQLTPSSCSLHWRLLSKTPQLLTRVTWRLFYSLFPIE